MLQGESEIALDNRLLGAFERLGVRPAPRGVPSIGISFEVDEEGIVHVMARDQDTGLAQQIRIDDAGGLTEAEIERLLAATTARRAAEAERRARTAARNEAMRCVLEAERALRGAAGARLPPPVRDALTNTITDLQEALERDTGAEQLDRLRRQLEARLAQLGVARARLNSRIPESPNPQSAGPDALPAPE